jgi:glycerol kinase
MQFAADLTGVELHEAAAADSSAWGAALAGMLGRGVYHSLDEIAAVPVDGRVYRPAMVAEHRERLYAGWQAAVRRVLPAGERH